MFILHSAANSELLVTELITTFTNQPTKTVFTQDLFLVANPGMERWLSQQLAQQFGVFANYQFLLPAAFFKQLARKLDSHLHHPDFDSELMLWRINGLLHEIDDAIFLPVKQYLTGENTAIKRYQLAKQLAQLFQNYQLLRPDLLADWQQNPDLHCWQQALWQKITAQIGANHQGELWLKAIEKVTLAATGSFRYQLPERLFVFGIHNLPPLWLQFLHAISKHCDVHFYWLSALPVLSTDSASFHPLLSCLGQQNIEFQQALLNYSDKVNRVTASQQTPLTVLEQLQKDLCQTQQAKVLKMSADSSISIHACHSKMREVEVLKNQLLHTLENTPHLQLREIIVTAPDIQVYAPFVSAVFADIPHYMVGSKAITHQVSLLDSLLRFLKLADSRFGWQAVLDLLEQPNVYPNFDLSESDLKLVKQWLIDTNVRWGKSAQHKAQQGLPALSENTWQQSLERLLMGYAVSEDNDFVDNVLPYKELEGASAQALGGLYDFIALLFNASERLNQPAPLKTWTELLYHYADLLFAQISPYQRQELNDLLADFAESIADIHQYPLELGVIIHWLEHALSDQKSASGLLRGGLTFCSINNVRGIPFQVIGVLGMNDGDFPRPDKHPTFDLVAQNPRLGDPSQRADDRQQFLELLLCARQQLIITYLGQSLAQNQNIPPSVVISELLEVLEFDYQMTDIVVKQPLQPFSPRYFTGTNPTLFSYSKTDFETALALNTIKPKAKRWWQGDIISTPTNQLLELTDIVLFYRHPQRYFLRRQLDLRLQTLSASAEEREPFEIDGLESYAINHDWINALLNGENFNLAKLQAQGRWLSGVMGNLAFGQQEAKVVDFVNKIHALNLGNKRPDLAIDLNFAAYRLTGKLSNLYENGCLFYRFSTLKGKDLLIALLQHCLLNQVQPSNTYLLSIDAELVLTPNLINPKTLEALLTTYLKGQQRPDALFTESVLDYVKQANSLENSSKAQKSALQVAQEKLMLSLAQAYEPELQRLYAGDECFTDVLGDEFVLFCEEVVLPVWRNIASV